jgi:hypothetical protein
MFLFSFICLEDIEKYCPNLKALDVGWCHEVTDSGVRVIFRYQQIFGLLWSHTL